jgi:hypothetical protein
MKPSAISLPVALAMTLLAAPVAAWADANPDFDDDAKPILGRQPGLVQYVESRYEVKDTGTAKFPGDDDRRPQPPFIFRARPAGSHGPYNFRLLIQPGPPGHILGVVDITKAHLGAPAPSSNPSAVANQPAPREQVPMQQAAAPAQEAPAPAPQQPAEPAASPSEPTADTPSGPIKDTGSSDQSSPSLAPPPDPAPATH